MAEAIKVTEQNTIKINRKETLTASVDACALKHAPRTLNFSLLKVLTS